MKKILLVEDDKFLVRVYENKLIKAGFNVYFVENGLDIVNTTKKFNPDLIILDLILPKKDGFVALKELKEDLNTKNIPVIVLSLLNMDEDVKNTTKLGAITHLNKTNIVFNDVLNAIEKYIK